jgi:hypothetical protein
MKYSKPSENCKCGNARRAGQRDCAECHAETVRESRRRQAEPVEALCATMRKVMKKGPKRALPPEIEQRMRDLAMRVANEIEQFNGYGAA